MWFWKGTVLTGSSFEDLFPRPWWHFRRLWNFGGGVGHQGQGFQGYSCLLFQPLYLQVHCDGDSLYLTVPFPGTELPTRPAHCDQLTEKSPNSCAIWFSSPQFSGPGNLVMVTWKLLIDPLTTEGRLPRESITRSRLPVSLLLWTRAKQSKICELKVVWS